MKKFIVIPVIAASLFAGCGAQEQDMTQFNSDLSTYMSKQVAPAVIVAKCAPLTNGVTNCNITIQAKDGVDKATAENVRRVGDKFTWDHES